MYHPELSKMEFFSYHITIKYISMQLEQHPKDHIHTKG
jgi:hypothetical protein